MSPRRSRRHRAAGALAVLAALAVSTGLLGASLPAPADAQTAQADLLPGLGGLLPLPGGSSSTSQPAAPQAPQPSPAPQPAPPSGSAPSNPLQPLLPGQPPAPQQGAGGGLLQPLLPGGQQGQGAPLPGLGALPPNLLPPGLHLPVGPPATPTAGPGNAWSLTGTKMKLVGSHYDGVATQQVDGKPVKALHFTVDRLEITDLVQKADLGNGKIVTAAAPPGSTSTVSSGPIELYTRDMSGNLSVAGLPGVPLRLSPDTIGLAGLDLSFLQLPTLTLSNVVVNNTLLSGGQLQIPGSHLSVG